MKYSSNVNARGKILDHFYGGYVVVFRKEENSKGESEQTHDCSDLVMPTL